MNEGIIQNINSVVQPEDTLIIVGDAVMGQRVHTLPLIGRINCSVELVLGNHDNPHPAHTGKSMWDEYNAQFANIYIRRLMIVGDLTVELTHFPFTGDSHDEDRYNDYRPVDEGQVVVHGHVHSREIITGNRQVHVGIDSDWTEYGVERYHPIPWITVQEVILTNFN